MIINQLILKNFRIFKGIHGFDFSNSELIVIDGANGHGKSTIFDAISWVLSGKIERYVGSDEYRKFNYLINNYANSKGENASVQIELKEKEQKIVIKREIKDRSEILYINEKRYNLKDGQSEINKLLIENPGEQLVGNQQNTFDLSELLTSSVILSQEGLQDFVRSNKPTERYRVLEKTLGLARYGDNFREFLKDVNKNNEKKRGKLEKKVEEINHKIEVLDIKYKEKIKYEKRLGIKDEFDLIQEIKDLLIDLDIENSEQKIDSETTETNILFLEEVKKDNISLLNKLIELQGSLKYNNLLELNSDMIQQRKEEFHRNKKSLDNRKNNLTQTIEDIKKTKNNTINIADIVDKIRKIDTKLEENKLKIENYNNLKCNILKDLFKEYNESNLEDPQSFIREFDEWKEKLRQYKYIESIFSNKNKITDLRNQKIKNENLLKQLIASRDNKLKKITKLNLSINDLSSKIEYKKSSHVKKLVNEVQQEILSSKDSESCLVCGTIFNSEYELKETVRKKLNESFEHLNDLEKENRKLELLKSGIVSEEETIIWKIEITKNNIESIDNTINKINQKNIGYIAEINIRTDEIDMLELLDKIKNLEETINKYKYKYNLAKKKYDIVAETQEIINMNIDFEAKKKELLTIDPDIHKYLQGYDSIESKLSVLDIDINQTERELQKIKNEIGKENSKIINLKTMKEMLLSYSTEVENTLDINITELDGIKLYNIINKNIKKRRSAIENIDITIYRVNNYVEGTELIKLQNKMEENQRILEYNKEKLDKHNILASQLSLFGNNHDEVQSDLINQYLSDLTDVINNFYQQISPHSYFNYLNLVVDKNRLYILLDEKRKGGSQNYELNFEKSMNAGLTLSAGQSTVLAMSIFLALNYSQNWSKLNTLAIDDPFQNLDDINSYSFIDIIGSLIKKENKQIFISTHNSDFSQLILSKLRLKKSRYSRITFKSYAKEGMLIKSNCHTELRS